MQQEIWRDIKGYKGYYQVSNFGRVKRIVSKNRPSEKIRKIQYKRNGYAVVMLSVAQKYKLAHVHRLVANAFLPNHKKKPQVNHKDLNKKNNNVSNLEWVTLQENVNHVHSMKKWSNNVKSGDQNKRSIRVYQFSLSGNKIKEWVSISEASNKLNIASGDISNACQKKRKSAGGFQWKYANDSGVVMAVNYGRKRVYQLSMEGVFIKDYDNVFLASKINNLSNAGIWNCCNGKYKSCGGYKWSYDTHLT